eukprot:504840_1
MSDVDLLKNVLELYSMWSYHLYGNTIPKLFQCDPPDVSNQLLPGIYRPETGQLVCPDHPMQKPHLRAAVIASSASILKLSRSLSMNGFGSASKANPPPRGISIAAAGA